MHYDKLHSISMSGSLAGRLRRKSLCGFMCKATNYSLSQCNDTSRILYTNMHYIITFFEDNRMTIMP